MFVDSFLLVGEQFTASSTRTAFSNTNRSFDLKFFKKLLFVSACIVFAAICFTGSATAQGRDRVVKPTASQPTNLPPPPVKIDKTNSSRAILTNDVVVVKSPAPSGPLVKKTGSSAPVNAP